MIEIAIQSVAVPWHIHKAEASFDHATAVGPKWLLSTRRGTRVKVREVIQLLEARGWRLVRQKGSHRQFKHDRRPGLVTIAGKPGDDLAPGTLNSIFKQAGLKL